MTTPMVWNYNQIIQMPTQPITNQPYQTLAKKFIDKYISMVGFGISNCGSCYSDISKISLHIHNNTNNCNQLYEIIGYDSFKTTLLGLAIVQIKYNNVIYTCQPVGKKSILISFYGLSDINSKYYQTLSTIIFSIDKINSCKVINQTIDIFM